MQILLCRLKFESKMERFYRMPFIFIFFLNTYLFEPIITCFLYISRKFMKKIAENIVFEKSKIAADLLANDCNHNNSS